MQLCTDRGKVAKDEGGRNVGKGEGEKEDQEGTHYNQKRKGGKKKKDCE